MTEAPSDRSASRQGAVGLDRAARRLVRGVTLAARAPRALGGRFRYLLVLSHMRGYTSLLAHILGSHRGVSGYFELHQGYERRLDLVRMRLSVLRGLDGPVRGPYVLDKIVHSRYGVAPEILRRHDVFTLFMMREPGPTLESCLDVRAFHGDPAAAPPYYIERVATLAEMAAVARHAAYLEAEALLSRTDVVLRSIGSYLGLRSPLSPAYSTFRFTGRRGIGDWSDALMGGEIVSPRRGRPSGLIPAGALREAGPRSNRPAGRCSAHAGTVTDPSGGAGRPCGRAGPGQPA